MLKTLVLALLAFPTLGIAQHAPVADGFRGNFKRIENLLILSSAEMPADKYGFKPTPAQMTFGEVVAHLSEDNDFLCGAIGGTKAPARTTVEATDTKDHLMARLKETFAFCDQVFASLDDQKLTESLPFVGGIHESRVFMMFQSEGHWADHYSQDAIYLRLNGLLPPTATNPNL